jgi:hypothetical protein
VNNCNQRFLEGIEVKLSQENEIPTHSWTFWGILLFLFLLVMILTVAKDWWLTTEQPNIATNVIGLATPGS